jgi:hypothetical protein
MIHVYCTLRATALVRQARIRLSLSPPGSSKACGSLKISAQASIITSDAAIPADKLIQGVPAVCPGATSGLSPSTYSFEE